MSSISNRFFVTAIEDGTTLHGSILSTKSLSQAWDGSAASPDWSEPENQPIIYIRLYNGNTEIDTDEFYGTWKYDGQDISFDPVTKESSDGKFKKTNYQDFTHAIQIIDNLIDTASNENHYISFEGGYTPQTGQTGAQSVGFTVSLKINISTLQQGSYFGIIEFDGGKNYFDRDGEFIILKPHFYKGGSASEIASSDFDVHYWINGARVTNTSSSNGSYYSGNLLYLCESDVVDNAIITARFKMKSSDGYDYTDYTSVDDLTDPEFMYIQYNNSNGQTATLRDGQKIKFYAWIGSMTSPEPDNRYNSFKIKFLDSAGEVNEEDLSTYDLEADTATQVTDGWRPMMRGSSPDYGDGKSRAYCTISNKLVKRLGNNLTGIILAEQVTNS